MPKPPTVARLDWQHALVFNAASGPNAMVIDGDGRQGPSPVQALAFSLAGCMATDVAHILSKGRHPLRGLRAELVAHRAAEDPHRFTSVSIQLTVEGDISDNAVSRAIALSHDTYCSVWHSMRQDIAFTTSFQVIR